MNKKQILPIAAMTLWGFVVFMNARKIILIGSGNGGSLTNFFPLFVVLMIIGMFGIMHSYDRFKEIPKSKKIKPQPYPLANTLSGLQLQKIELFEKYKAQRELMESLIINSPEFKEALKELRKIHIAMNNVSKAMSNITYPYITDRF